LIEWLYERQDHIISNPPSKVHKQAVARWLIAAVQANEKVTGTFPISPKVRWRPWPLPNHPPTQRSAFPKAGTVFGTDLPA
jgi:hypothetical protein